MKSDERTQQDSGIQARPEYQKPAIRMLSEREVLNEFQITQSMAVWWATLAC